MSIIIINQYKKGEISQKTRNTERQLPQQDRHRNIDSAQLTKRCIVYSLDRLLEFVDRCSIRLYILKEKCEALKENCLGSQHQSNYHVVSIRPKS